MKIVPTLYDIYFMAILLVNPSLLTYEKKIIEYDT